MEKNVAGDQKMAACPSRQRGTREKTRRRLDEVLAHSGYRTLQLHAHWISFTPSEGRVVLAGWMRDLDLTRGSLGQALSQLQAPLTG